MKKRLIIIIFLVVISGATLIVLLSDPWSSIDSGFEGLLLESREEIDKIEVIGSTDSLAILKVGEEWHLNGEKLNTLPVESLLFTSSKFRVVSILSIEETASQQDFVSLNFFEGKKLRSSFRFMEIRGKSIIYSEGGVNAYMVELPGYDDITLRKVFSADPDHYRDHLLVSMLPDEIAEIEISPLRGSAFSVIQDSDSQLLVKDKDGRELSVSERKIRLLLSYFSAIRFEEYLPGEKIPADFDPSSPSATIVLKDFEGLGHELKVYSWIKTEGDQPDLFSALLLFDQDPQIMIVNYTYLDLLIRGLETYLPSQ